MEATKDTANTPVKVKIQRLEHKSEPVLKTPAKRKRGLGGQGRQPSPPSNSKQAKLTLYFGKKSPKAQNIREKQQEGPHVENKQSTSIQGALGPLLGDLGGLKDHPIADTDTGAEKTSGAPVGTSEERGRSPRNKKPDKKKAIKALEKRDQGPSKETKGPQKETKNRRQRKLEDNQPGKGVQDLRRWFERKEPGTEPDRKDMKQENERRTK